MNTQGVFKNSIHSKQENFIWAVGNHQHYQVNIWFKHLKVLWPLDWCAFQVNGWNLFINMEWGSRKRWWSATRAWKWPLNPQRWTAARPFSIFPFPLYSAAAQTSSSKGPRRGRTRIRPQQDLRETTPSIYSGQSLNHTWFQRAYKPQRKVPTVIYAQEVHINTMVHLPSSSWAAQAYFYHWEKAVIWIFAQQ